MRFFLHFPTARDTLIRPSSPRRMECIWFVPRFESDKRYIPKIGFPFCVWLGVRLFVVVVWLIGVCVPFFVCPPLSKTARQSSSCSGPEIGVDPVVSVRSIFRKCFMCWLNTELWLNKPHFHSSTQLTPKTLTQVDVIPSDWDWPILRLETQLVRFSIAVEIGCTPR